MGIYAEALILYILLFFSGLAAFFSGLTEKTPEFSVMAELVRIIMYYIPAIALIWHLQLNRSHQIKVSEHPVTEKQKKDIQILKFQKKDFISFVIALPCLIFTGSVITILSALTNSSSAPEIFSSPSTITGWIILCLTCVFSAYLEESYFRFYILSNKNEMNLKAPAALILSVILFSFCHIYGGFFGFLNAFLCGALLGIIFLRFKSIHGIAIAHCIYNISAFVLSAIM